MPTACNASGLYQGSYSDGSCTMLTSAPYVTPVGCTLGSGGVPPAATAIQCNSATSFPGSVAIKAYCGVLVYSLYASTACLTVGGGQYSITDCASGLIRTYSDSACTTQVATASIYNTYKITFCNGVTVNCNGNMLTSIGSYNTGATSGLMAVVAMMVMKMLL